ncbi:DUF4810 domain-containing protein [uncultured Dechloromonas sp.]|uniref:DUF4810 domain-containing protein n=1 Tax=uncultured Dechloromonas sp. TaxID=171719 RepID=UPI0025F45426|nr:DUF4810 domain-containing protein [uncultured Dechloromonas sp.]
MLRTHPKQGPLLLTALLAATLAGCATRQQPLYYWGNFQDQQYAYFKGDKGPEDGIQNLERVREEARSRGRPVPPGFQAHLGMLYGQTGRTDLFEQNLLAERQQFPESAVYVDFLLKKQQKQEGSR